MRRLGSSWVSRYLHMSSLAALVAIDSICHEVLSWITTGLDVNEPLARLSEGHLRETILYYLLYMSYEYHDKYSLEGLVYVPRAC